MSLSDFKARKQINNNELLLIIDTLKNDYSLNIGLFIPIRDKKERIVLRIKNYIFLYENINLLWEDLKEIVITAIEQEEQILHKQFLLRNEINNTLEQIQKKYNEYEISVRVKNGN